MPDQPLAVGELLHGFCGGLFGRDHYTCSNIEAIGPDWVLVRHRDGGGVHIAVGSDVERRLREFREPPDWPTDCCEDAGRA